ncbi:CRISPR-associated protein Cas4 [Pseudothermotoga hypogea DSM 11164 = NBRC 106472]|uniref:CRISPR-associated exonuclease Cas4 n=1 Tax=Pseudothermotoga hypogea DSM 11164 = NBRC 106472 TaxID=1123384 RepID=A0A0X1KR40_9THEM|nr:CRISPR-associated protein Cas4 [Pseudothermotoga hypogea DSM 11164 = NBRC 106472]MBC7123117.1 CRISPR-associated protein Cas4 [Pseudothermotoga sp.]
MTGTVLLSSTVCEREAWLIAHQIEPDQYNPFIEIGRLIHTESYKNNRIREISLPGIKIDMIYEQGEMVVVGEIKKSSKFLKGARVQLLYYLSEIKKRGVQAVGKILIPKEKKQITVVLDEQSSTELNEAIKKAEEIISLPKPPQRRRSSFCSKCGYQEFCWS